MNPSQTHRSAVARVRRKVNSGVLAAFGCYIIWGLFPLYWKALGHVDPVEIICQRIIWCFVFTAIICALSKHNFMALLRIARARRFLIPAAILVTTNWSIYIFAVEIGKIVDASLGYYINPLVSIVLGLIIFKEQLSVPQWIAVGLCCVGIGYFTFSYGTFPWISILLAVSFGIYGALKKKGGYPPVEAIAVEGFVTMPIALVISLVMVFFVQSPFGQGFLGDVTSVQGWATTLLLIGGGVITAVPLILFAKAANTIPLTLMGFLQFISPTCALLIGVFVFGEPFTFAHGVCFGCIWLGLVLVSIDSVLALHHAGRKKLTPIEQESR